MESLNGVIHYNNSNIVNDESSSNGQIINNGVVWEGIQDSLFYSCNKFDDDCFYEKYHICYPDLEQIRDLENDEDYVRFDKLGGLFIKFDPEFAHFHCYESDIYRETNESSNFKIKRTKLVNKQVALFLKDIRKIMIKTHNNFVMDSYKTNSKNTELLRPTFEYFSKWKHCDPQFKKVVQRR